MYVLKATVTIMPQIPDCATNQRHVLALAEKFCKPLLALGFQATQNQAWYYPDEAHEAQGQNYICVNIDLQRECQSFQALTHTAQLVQSLTLLHYAEEQVTYLCNFQNPLSVP